MVERPTGTVTFLFTDVEGSTRLWEEHPERMQAALERHDEILRSAIEGHGGYVFSTAGDAFAAAYARAGDAVAAAVEAQLALGVEPWPETTVVRARMGLHTGEAQERDGDYFGPVLNRAARVMSAGHGGQILVATSTASLVQDVELVDLGEHRLKDLSGVERLFQVCAEGLEEQFAALRTVDAVPGNLPVQVTSFVGRDIEVKELTDLVRAHRLVTLTGVGGVGKTRLAMQVAANSLAEFSDGVWLVELAPVGDPAAVPDVVATSLGITAQAGRSVTDSIAEALSGRRLLVVLDNCEHVLDVAAGLVETVLARAGTVKVIATSREGLRVGAEHLWPVPPLDFEAGASSAAVELFVERAQRVSPGFELGEAADSIAVTEICQQLDGIALAIELAAARMVSMSPGEVLERLTDRFRLLTGSPRGPERHQTLRHAVAWSYDLLADDEQTLLNSCAVFADGFDLAAASQICGVEFDDYAVLDLLDSLVRKSLITAEHIVGRTRYGLLETIRQFAEDQLAETGTISQVRDRHATYFAAQAVVQWDNWAGADQRLVLEWVDVEFANLRSGFRWATDQDDLVTATAIAAHVTLMCWPLQRFEPVGWAEEILEAATTADLPQLPRLYTAASLCQLTGRPEEGVGYAETASALESDPRYDPFEIGWRAYSEASGHAFAGRMDRAVEICTDLAAQPGLAHVIGLCGMLFLLRAAGRAEKSRAIADEALAAARDHGNPFLIANALGGYGRAFIETDPERALTAFRQGLLYAREHRDPFWEANIARDAAGHEAVHGDLKTGLELFDTAIDSSHRAGNIAIMAIALAKLAVFFDRIEKPTSAATIYGTTTHYAITNALISVPPAVDHLRTVLGDATFEECVAAGADMHLGDAVQYARRQIQTARHQLLHPT